ncbi:hypothetical protein PILCRDRAFT_99398 [Piloderma croceum F 1598]|uniref:Crinkler effector protein N-terminal domain-containing protein n=1 Tax=Piloderma croceum (strain F 1598) TaxID=765440 RepID=A0A0C3AEM6_PILCF|nr:hypothetical protein PILCRDRAFT_99398 [Piloderma croceum F 1598]
MFATSVMSQDGSCRLNCLIEGESIVFVVTTGHDCAVSNLKEDVQCKQAMDTLKDVGPHTLELWKVSAINELRCEVMSLTPTIGPLGKRTAPEPTDIFDRLKCAKFVTTVPSTTGKSDIYQCLQHQPSEKILDDCPEPDPDIPPIPLFYDSFGHFLDIMDTYEWIDAALPCLNHIFSVCRGINIPELATKAIGSIRTGHNTADHGAGSMTTAFKNWTTGISSLPQIELVCYIARLNAMAMNKEARCDITFYAVIAIDHCFRIVTLTPTFSCIQSVSDGHNHTFPYSAFTVASVLQAHILQDTTRLLNNPPAVIPAPACHFPAMPGADKQLILIKFVRRYSIELHEICAKSGHAPPILTFEQLPGGWFAGIMGSFHEKDLVHSDLWDANIICKNDSVMLIDFNWGGKEGEVSYPTSNLNAELLQGRVSGDLRIMKEDDRRVVPIPLGSAGQLLLAFPL